MSPSQQIVGKMLKTEELTDKKGRKLTVRELRGRELSRFYRFAGKYAEGDDWFNTTMIRATVRAVDGIPCLEPESTEDLDKLWDVVDEVMIATVGPWLAQKLKERTADNAVGESTETPSLEQDST